uniref:Uncharacterized protein n=1 Tax=Caenorhabditis tropicalis TaxID=1561998 RepID=A0A1I7T4D0_9PELO
MFLLTEAGPYRYYGNNYRYNQYPTYYNQGYNNYYQGDRTPYQYQGYTNYYQNYNYQNSYAQPSYGNGINYDSNGNSFIGTKDNGIYLFCNGVGCPGRG